MPSLLGGPWRWDQILSSIPWADPPGILVLSSLLALGAAVALTLRRKRRVGGVWLLLAGYVGVCLAAMVVARSGPYTAPVLGQSLRYVADSVVVVAVAMALIWCAPDRESKAASGEAHRWVRSATALAVAVAFQVSSLVSTLAFSRSWSHIPTATYLTTLRASLASNRDAPLLDQPISERILWRLASPYDFVSRVLSPLDASGIATPVLRRLDDSGHVVPAQMSTARTAAIGPFPRCGYQVSDLGFTSIPLDGPLIEWSWTVHFGYLTGGSGSLEVELEAGKAVIVPVAQGLNQVFVRVVGKGSTLQVRSHTPGMVACVAGATVGLVQDPSARP